MAEIFPAFNKSEKGTIADLNNVWTQRAIVWANYRGSYIRALSESTVKVKINGREYYSGFEINPDAIKSPTNNEHPHVAYLRLLGMSDEDMYQLWKEGFEPSEVDHIQHYWKDPETEYSLEQAERFYDDIVNALSIATTVELEGETVSYWETITDRPEVAVQAIGEHSEPVSSINDNDLVFYEKIQATTTNTTDVLKSKNMDKDLTVKLLNGIVDVTPTDEKLLSAIKALILLEGDSFMVRTATSKVSERLESQAYYVTTKMQYDTSTVPTLYDMSGYLYTETESYTDGRQVVGSIALVKNTLAIWKNYFWRYKELETEEGKVELATNGFMTLLNGKYYVSVSKLESMTSSDFEEIISPAIDIRSVLDDQSFWRIVLGGIAELLNQLYGGIYNLLKHIPYFALKEEQIVDYLVKYGDPFSSKTFTKEEAEEYMEEVGIASIGLTITIIIAILAGPEFFALLAVDIGVAAYSSYIKVEQGYENYLLQQERALLEEMTKEELEDKAEEIETQRMIDSGDFSKWELNNYVMYEAMYNEMFKPRLKHSAPFDRGQEYDLKLGRKEN